MFYSDKEKLFRVVRHAESPTFYIYIFDLFNNWFLKIYSRAKPWGCLTCPWARRRSCSRSTILLVSPEKRTKQKMSKYEKTNLQNGIVSKTLNEMRKNF
jgi:hypothetical protein